MCLKQWLPSQDLQRANCQGLGVCSVDNCLPSDAWHTCHSALYPRQSPRRCRCLLQCQLAQQTPTPMLNKQITGTLNWMFGWYSDEFDCFDDFPFFNLNTCILYKQSKAPLPGHPTTSNRREQCLFHDLGCIRKHRARIYLNALLTIVSPSELPANVWMYVKIKCYPVCFIKLGIITNKNNTLCYA